MKYSILMVACVAAVFSFSSCDGQKKGKDSSFKLTNAADSASYGIGTSIGRNMKKDGLDSMNVDLIAQGLRDVLGGKTEALTPEQAQTAIQSYFQGVQDKKMASNTEAGRKFLEENSKKPGVVTLPSGLQYQIIQEGTGAKPTAEDKVTTHYHGTLISGKVFDSSVERGQPASFAVNGVIPGWTEALQLMPVGSKWKLFIPSNLAYGERGAGGDIGPNETLIFEVELLSIDK